MSGWKHTITNDFKNLFFHDAKIISMEVRTNSTGIFELSLKIESAHVLKSHVANTTGKNFCIDVCELVFREVLNLSFSPSEKMEVNGDYVNELSQKDILELKESSGSQGYYILYYNKNDFMKCTISAGGFALYYNEISFDSWVAVLK